MGQMGQMSLSGWSGSWSKWWLEQIEFSCHGVICTNRICHLQWIVFVICTNRICHLQWIAPIQYKTVHLGNVICNEFVICAARLLWTTADAQLNAESDTIRLIIARTAKHRCLHCNVHCTMYKAVITPKWEYVSDMVMYALYGPLSMDKTLPH